MTPSRWPARSTERLIRDAIETLERLSPRVALHAPQEQMDTDPLCRCDGYRQCKGGCNDYREALDTLREAAERIGET